MMAFSLHRKSLSYELATINKSCVLSVPGESLAAVALLCGTRSGRGTNKVKDAGVILVQSETVPVPGIMQAKANIEMEIVNRIQTGDHLTVVGKVLKYAVNVHNKERCLLSVGPEHEGYDVLAQKGIHRIAVVKNEQPNRGA